MASKLEELRSEKNMVEVINVLSEMESTIFSITTNTELFFNFIDLSFQFFDKQINETFNKLNIHIYEIRRYYNKKFDSIIFI